MNRTLPLLAVVLITVSPLAAGQLLNTLTEAPETAETTPVDVFEPANPVEPAAPADPIGAPAILTQDGGRNVHWNYASTPKMVYRGPGETQDFQWRCPEPPDGIPVGISEGGTDPVVYGCPLRIYDGNGALGHALGAPDLAVMHTDHNQVAFASLHGAATSGNAPHNYSRGVNTGYHGTTVFPSTDQGITWGDDPPPQGTMPNTALASDASIVMDSAGNLYVAFLYDIPTGPDTWDAAVQLVKGPPAGEFSTQNGVYNGATVVYGADLNNRVDRVHLVHKPYYVPLKEVEAEEFNESAPPTNETENGQVAFQPDYENATEERIVATWFERAYDWETTTMEMSGWISVAWTHTGPANDWEFMEKEQTIGPCKGASNPVHWEGMIYVACVVEAGYSDRRTALIGDIDLWQIDVINGNATLMDFTGLNGGQPLLTVNEDGYFNILSYEKLYTTDGEFRRLSTASAESWYGTGWDRPNTFDLGPELRRWGGGENVPVFDADITAFTSITEEPTMYVMYKEFHDDPQDVSQEDPPDPEDPFHTIDQRLTDYHKYLFSFNNCDGPIAAAEMELGEAVDAYNADSYQTNPAAFNEVRDALFVTRDVNGDEVIYFAAGDYGAIQYGAVVGGQSSTFCTFPPLPVIPPPPAVVPAALGLSTGIPATLGVAFGVPLAAMTGYLLTTKRRSPSYVTAEDE